jgi:predicted secreted protein
MAAIPGRDVIIKKNNTAIAAVRVTTASVDNSPVDITSRDSAGFRALASFAGTRALEITGEGLWDDDVMTALAFGTASKLLTDITLTYGGSPAKVITGNFYLASLDLTGDHSDAATQSFTLQSSGSWSVA